MVGRFHFRSHTRALTLSTVFVLAGACATQPTSTGWPDTGTALPTGKITQDQVCGRPEATVMYPGATQLMEFGRGEEGLNDAFCGRSIATADDQTKVYDFYTKYFLDRGFQYYSGGGGGAMIASRIFERAPSCREYVTMGTANPRTYKTIGLNPPVIPPGTRTVFEYRYSIGAGDQSPCHPVVSIPPVPTTDQPLVSTG